MAKQSKKAAAKPAAKKTKPKISHNLADPGTVKKLADAKAKKTATAATPVTPAPKPTGAAKVVKVATTGGNVFDLIHQCWTLFKPLDDRDRAEALELHPTTAGIVWGYGQGLCVPRAEALAPLEAFRKWLAKEAEPKCDDPAAHLNLPAGPQPWEPVPEGIRRMMAGESPDTEHGTWFVDGKVWEFRAGWTEPKLTGEHVKSEYASSVALIEAAENGERIGNDLGEPADAVSVARQNADDMTVTAPIPFDPPEGDPTPDPYPVSVKPVDEGGQDRDVVDDSDGDTLAQLAEQNESEKHQAFLETVCVTGAAGEVSEVNEDADAAPDFGGYIKAAEHRTAPPVGPDDIFDLDGQADYEPTREELEAEERQREREEAEEKAKPKPKKRR